ncbi:MULTISPECIES: NUDIX domain-containing protein [Candidatus Ichthyocystis]|uniref:NUDIX domain-containing protein n=1 Tax=Candidatus Ichthyocystis TaxID=2929841 RepID=UPI000B862C6F|nr:MULTISPECIES: NUDIX domain-containing protein [Ichthyocystis]
MGRDSLMLADDDSVFFRVGVGAIIMDCSLDKLLLFRRSDYTGTWQCPQGGVNKNEQTDEAIFREVFEETGILSQELKVIAVCPVWVGYELPMTDKSSCFSKGQVHRWYVLQLLTSYDALRSTESCEFIDASWCLVEDWASTAPDFKKDAVNFLISWLMNVKVSSDVDSKGSV